MGILQFVLSGFVLTFKFFKTGDSDIIKASAAKKYVRLVIPVLFSMLLFYLLHVLFTPNINDLTLLGAFKEGLYHSLMQKRILAYLFVSLAVWDTPY